MDKRIALVLLLLPNLLMAQIDVSPVVIKNGKEYYEHSVVEGNTLWGLQRMYGVSAEEIVDENPSLQEGLKVGQKVYLPKLTETENPMETESYKVKKGETLYGLSRRFEISIDELMNLNPDLRDGGLQKGQIIQVPAGGLSSPVELEQSDTRTTPNPFVTDTIENPDGSADQIAFSFSDSTIRHVVMRHETMYKISKRFMIPVEDIMRINGLKSTSVKEGQVLVIPVKKERFDLVEVRPVPPSYDPNGEGPLEFEEKSRYKVVMMLPFHLDAGPSYSKYHSEMSTQFYMGTRMALDSLKRKGLKADVVYLDTRNDSTCILKLLKDTSLLSADLIIGPFFEKNARIVADFCKQNRIRMVCPTALPDDILEGNRLVYAGIPSDEALFRMLAEHMAKNNTKERIVLVKPKKEEEIKLYDAFKGAYNDLDLGQSTLIESTIGGFSGYVSRGINCNFIMPTNDRRTALEFMNNLNKKASRSNTLPIYLYGMKSWMNFSDIKMMYYNKYHFHFPSSNFIDYYTEPMKDLNKIHRNWYKTDLSKMAVHGYDITMNFCSEFFLGKKSYLMMSDFQMEQVDPNSGYNHTDIFVVEQEEFELFNSKIPRD